LPNTGTSGCADNPAPAASDHPTLAAAFTAAWVLGIITQKLRLSPIVGYLLAGVAIGPHTPGFIGDVSIANQLAEFGVILLMFGVGLHFHLDDLLAVRDVAVPGAIGQTLVATLLGAAVSVAFGMPAKAGQVTGMTKAGRAAIYGDAFNIEVMHQALPRAPHLIITLPHSANRNPLIVSAKLINPEIRIFVRARYLAEREELRQAGADAAVYEEAEAAVALARLLLADRGADDQTVRRETTRIRQDFAAPA
jgi:hypothetical protein